MIAIKIEHMISALVRTFDVEDMTEDEIRAEYYNEHANEHCPNCFEKYNVFVKLRDFRLNEADDLPALTCVDCELIILDGEILYGDEPTIPINLGAIRVNHHRNLWVRQIG